MGKPKKLDGNAANGTLRTPNGIVRTDNYLKCPVCKRWHDRFPGDRGLSSHIETHRMHTLNEEETAALASYDMLSSDEKLSKNNKLFDRQRLTPNERNDANGLATALWELNHPNEPLRKAHAPTVPRARKIVRIRDEAAELAELAPSPKEIEEMELEMVANHNDGAEMIPSHNEELTVMTPTRDVDPAETTFSLNGQARQRPSELDKMAHNRSTDRKVKTSVEGFMEYIKNEPIERLNDYHNILNEEIQKKYIEKLFN